ncbi:MAG: hypothetical protein ACI9Y7_001999 [Dokdonia sp.]|jgi:hypothetical protein
MANSLSGYCGTVTQDGQITSNGNFSCQYTGAEYTIDYNGNVTNPVPVVSLTGQQPGMTYVLNAYSGGFKLYIYTSAIVPIASSFDFIVGEIV